MSLLVPWLRVFIYFSEIFNACYELTLWTVLTERRDVREMYTLKRVIRQSECTRPSLHLSLNLCVHSSIQVLESYVTCCLCSSLSH